MLQIVEGDAHRVEDNPKCPPMLSKDSEDFKRAANTCSNFIVQCRRPVNIVECVNHSAFDSNVQQVAGTRIESNKMPAILKEFLSPCDCQALRHLPGRCGSGRKMSY